MKSIKYWAKRADQKMFDYMEDAEKAADQIAEVYIRSVKYLQVSAKNIFDKYRTKHNLTETEARKLLNNLPDEWNYNDLLNKYKSAGIGTDKEDKLAKLESQAYRARIQRLESLYDQIDTVMKNIYDQEEQTHTERYIELAPEVYYRGIFEIQKRTEQDFEFSFVEPKVIDEVINTKWNGQNYSKRIWNRTSKLADTLKKELLVNMLTGRSERETAELIADLFSQTAFNARRLVRTESCYISNEMEGRSYEECEIEYYIFVATLDLVTSHVCRSLDNKRFKVKDRMPGLNYPAMHPWCRSTTIADITDTILQKLKRRARDPKTGRNILVPASMDYEEWYDTHVRGNEEAEAAEKAIQRKSSDRRQYERYVSVLGDAVPDNFYDFQSIKYNDAGKWELLKKEYRNRNKRG